MINLMKYSEDRRIGSNLSSRIFIPTEVLKLYQCSYEESMVFKWMILVFWHGKPTHVS